MRQKEVNAVCAKSRGELTKSSAPQAPRTAGLPGHDRLPEVSGSCNGFGLAFAGGGQSLPLLTRKRACLTPCPEGTWCSGITPAQHAGGPGFNPRCVHFCPQ